MQQERRSNQERSETTRGALLAAARALFVSRGYADTSTPQVAVDAGVSRGALYHQFDDKRALFRAVILAESQAVAQAIDAASAGESDARNRLISGARAYLQAMRVGGRCRLLLVEGPAVLGSAEMRSIDLANGARTLVDGLGEAVPHMGEDALTACSDLLSAAFDRAALAIDNGAEAGQYEEAAVDLLLTVLQKMGQSDQS